MNKYFTKEQVMKVLEEQNLMLDDIWGIEERLDELQGEEVVSVIHAEWLKRNGYTECSNCNYWYESSETEDEGDKNNYCPNCGAKMDREKDNG